MSRKPASHSVVSAAGNLAGPLLLGAGVTAGFYALIWYGPLNSDLMIRYFSGFWISYLATAMFCVGISALTIKFFGLLSQETSFGQIELPEKSADGDVEVESSQILTLLNEAPLTLRNSYLGRRLRDALDFVSQKNSADGIDDHLKYLADLDADRQHDSNALVRIIIWATPMLGFLGTVIGITLALGGLSGEQLASDPEAAMSGLVSGLYVAFDTTAVALGLAILLMFIQFLLDRFEMQHLERVDAFINAELTGRFAEVGGGNDPQVASMERMSRVMIRAAETLVTRQTELWQQSMQAAEERWNETSTQLADQLVTSLGVAIASSLEKHTAVIAETEHQAQERTAKTSLQFAEAIQTSSQALVTQQQALTTQTENMRETANATVDVIKLETALNENLRALAGAAHFEETVMSLSAAIQLLSARVGTTGGKGQAA